jgi:threonine dehydratase
MSCAPPAGAARSLGRRSAALPAPAERASARSWRLSATATRPARRTGPTAAPTSASAETRALWTRRLEARGWEAARALMAAAAAGDAEPLVTEAWRALDHVYGAGVLETAVLPAPWLADGAAGRGLRLKMEAQQVTGSFKARGAAHKLLSLDAAERAAGVVTSSTGNHALAVLHAAAALKAAGRPVAATVVVPTTLAPAKAAKLRAAAAAGGAALVTHGDDCLAAELHARSLAAERGLVYVSPYNDVAVAGGQGTLALELLMQLPRSAFDAVFIPVGGGGLAAGVAAVLKSFDPSIRIVGCQPEAQDHMRRSVAAGGAVELPWRDTLSDGTAGGLEPGALTIAACARLVDEWATVSEREIATAMLSVRAHAGFAVEGAAGVAAAAAARAAAARSNVAAVAIACGGNVGSEALEAAYALAGATASGDA